MSETNHELHAIIMSFALAAVLEPNEGIVVHHGGKGYFVFLVHDPENDSYDVVVNTDDAYLELSNFERVNMEETPELISSAAPKETLQ